MSWRASPDRTTAYCLIPTALTLDPSPLAPTPLCPASPLESQEFAMRPDVEAMKADIEQSIALLRRRL